MDDELELVPYEGSAADVAKTLRTSLSVVTDHLETILCDGLPPAGAEAAVGKAAEVADASRAAMKWAVKKARLALAVRIVDAPVRWPSGRDVGRMGDMAPIGQSVLRITLDNDNDVCLEMWDMGPHPLETYQRVNMEFCNGGGGGGQSPATRMALIALMHAIEADNANAPHKAWRSRAAGARAADGPGQGGVQA